MPSKGIIDRQRIAKTIVAAARMHAHEVGGRLPEVVASFVEEGETLPDFTTFQLQLARYLESRIDTIVQADELHLDELDDDQEPRRRRDRAAEVLYDTLVAVRESLNGPFGAERASEFLGIDGRTSSDPLILFRQADRAWKRLSAESPVLPPTRVDGIQADLGALAAQLRTPLDELGQALQRVDEESRAIESTLREKDLALDAFDLAVRSVGFLIKGLDGLAGFPEFSAKIRLTLPGRRRRGTGTGEESPLPEGGGEETSPEPEDGPPTDLPPVVPSPGPENGSGPEASGG
jgi:hypothetical protein